MPTALVTGVSGQDGSYLAELLLARGYRVIGVARSVTTPPFVPAAVEYRAVDATIPRAVRELVEATTPDEIYHLAGATSVADAWRDPEDALQRNAASAAALMAAVEAHAPTARVVCASSSEVFGVPAISPQHEESPIAPANPYGVAKAAVLLLGRAYRASRGLHVSSAILYNHESPRRSPAFVSRKITQGVAAIAAGRATTLTLGNLDARRDWGYAGDVVDALWRMAQQSTPADYVIGTGRSWSVRDLCAVAFGAVGLDYTRHVVSDPSLYRATDPTTMVADPRRAERGLGWRAHTAFDVMIRGMVAADVDALRETAGD